MVRYLHWAWTRGLLEPGRYHGDPPDDHDALLDLFDGKPGDQDFTERGWAFSGAYYPLWLREFESVAQSVCDALLDRRLAEWGAGDTQSWPRLEPLQRGVVWWQVLLAVVLVSMVVVGPYLHAAVGILGWLALGAAVSVRCVAGFRASRRVEWLGGCLGVVLIVFAVLIGSSLALTIGFVGLCSVGLSVCVALIRG
jgi:hypothetical protein